MSKKILAKNSDEIKNDPEFLTARPDFPKKEASSDESVFSDLEQPTAPAFDSSYKPVSVSRVFNSAQSANAETKDKNRAFEFFSAPSQDTSTSEKCFLLQLPPHLPLGTSGPLAKPLKPAEDGRENFLRSDLKPLPSGQIAEIVVFSSGDVKLKLGDVYYNVEQFALSDFC